MKLKKHSKCFKGNIPYIIDKENIYGKYNIILVLLISYLNLQKSYTLSHC